MSMLNVKGNTYCIDTGNSSIPFYKINAKDIIMLDTGLKKGERDIVNNILEENNFNVAGIINSHGHIDHTGNNIYLKNKYNSIIAMSAYESIICSSESNLKVYYGYQSLKDIKKHYGHIVSKADIIIEENQDELIMCEVKFKIIHTPGHSPGHICIVTPDEVVYLGDTLVSYDIMKDAKIPYTYILSEDMKSKSMLYDLNYSKYIIAHKGIYDNIKKLIDDNIDFYEDIAMKILEIVSVPMTMEEIMKCAVKKLAIKIHDIYKYYFIQMMLKSYVEYLYEIEKLNVIIDDGVLKYSK
ncbi:MAG: MBL fold metallo-hydrolase [Clostridium sp.]|nr:MBL fold metallo-hydrolase [Clostridium sp.]